MEGNAMEICEYLTGADGLNHIVLLGHQTLCKVTSIRWAPCDPDGPTCPDCLAAYEAALTPGPLG
jgi:hypothetical protein